MNPGDEYIIGQVIKAGLFFRRRDNWKAPDIAAALNHPDLRDYSIDVLERVALLCWLDKDVEHPDQLRTPGPWWTRAGLRPPSLIRSLPPRGVSSQEARDLARARLDAALHPKPGNEEIGSDQ